MVIHLTKADTSPLGATLSSSLDIISFDGSKFYCSPSKKEYMYDPTRTISHLAGYTKINKLESRPTNKLQSGTVLYSNQYDDGMASPVIHSFSFLFKI